MISEIEQDIARRITMDYPQIADDYKNGARLIGIVRKYNLSQKYKIALNVAEDCVRHSLELCLSAAERLRLGEFSSRRKQESYMESQFKEERNKSRLWSNEEIKYFLGLCKNPDCCIKAGLYKGRPDYELISKQLEKKYGNKRTINALRLVNSRKNNRKNIKNKCRRVKDNGC